MQRTVENVRVAIARTRTLKTMPESNLSTEITGCFEGHFKSAKATYQP